MQHEYKFHTNCATLVVVASLTWQSNQRRCGDWTPPADRNGVQAGLNRHPARILDDACLIMCYSCIVHASFMYHSCLVNVLLMSRPCLVHVSLMCYPCLAHVPLIADSLCIVHCV